MDDQSKALLEIRDKVTELCVNVKNLNDNLKDNYIPKSQQAVINDKVISIESSIVWLRRIVLGAIVSGIIGAVVMFK